ncbi:MAG: type II methionyl aminopeptidase [Sulfolobales archaeon]
MLCLHEDLLSDTRDLSIKTLDRFSFRSIYPSIPYICIRCSNSSEEEVKKYLKAGSIASSVMREAISMIRPGKLIYEIAEKIESRITELGGRPAFPVNISIANEAAHYTPVIRDPKKIPESGVVKIDLGVHVDGYIADMARSVDLDGRFERLVRAVEDALERAIERISVGVPAREVGRIIEATARSHGFKVVKNLSGHKMERYNLHAGYNVPNFSDPLVFWKFTNGSAYAIEPFLTTGSGMVSEDRKVVTIYSLRSLKGSLDERSREILSIVERRFSKLPFCGRWIKDVHPDPDGILRELYSRRILHGYPVLLDIPGSQVAQAEDTIVIFEGQVIVTTREGSSFRTM